MDNIEKINDIKYLIMEFYSDQEPLTEDQQKSKECFFRYCDEIKAELHALEILRIIFNAPSIINQLFELGKLGKDATQRYFWGTISDADVKKVEEFFADGKMQ